MEHPIKPTRPGLLPRIILAVIAGEAILVFLITIVQESIFGGITFTHSPWHHLLLGGAGTFLSAFIAGLAAYLLVDKRSVAPHIIISLLIGAESTWLILYGGSPDPAWFEVMATSSLLAGVWLGAFVFRADLHGAPRLKKSEGPEAAA
ncbi:MAG: hypothetical protein J5I94_16720 [Phaeodactylibacter sp.]|nr:hypothetical protein [Phaeodactylibacter sp.]